MRLSNRHSDDFSLCCQVRGPHLLSSSAPSRVVTCGVRTDGFAARRPCTAEVCNWIGDIWDASLGSGPVGNVARPAQRSAAASPGAGCPPCRSKRRAGTSGRRDRAAHAAGTGGSTIDTGTPSGCLEPTQKLLGPRHPRRFPPAEATT
ncbi:hypothetical protein JDM601_2217 [Mycolicibacter sinensis]|uniref:Uncharacterized protein n=1 Tax=Mycolicibacter sinensis (strain JDM601) TaxID=875328 RepID=F5YU26_MYCSD|nr:hypothetical protein JDM601_2217 [Mycolicibacter sinensis]